MDATPGLGAEDIPKGEPAAQQSPRPAAAHSPSPSRVSAASNGDAAVTSGAAGGAFPATPVTGALERFQRGAGNFQALIADLVAATEAERKKLEEERQELEAERAAWETERKRVDEVMLGAEQVMLNVGGFKFTTTVNTLRNAPAPSLFSAMFSGRHKLVKDEQGCFFIDRDGRHFHDILNFLRDGQFNYQSDSPDLKYLLELRAEANYYGLTGLMQAIDRFPHGLIKVSRASALNLEDSWMYEDGQDEIVFSVDKPLQLLGAGLCGTEGGLTVELELYEVDREDFSRELDTLSSCVQTFTKADGTLLRMMLPDPVVLQPGSVYMLSALIKGAESYCCEDCMDSVVAGGVTVRFHAWESPNGTNETRGQFPELLLRVL